MRAKVIGRPSIVTDARRADIMVFARQHRRRPCPAPDIHGRHQLADVAPSPAQFGEAAERAVLEGDGPVLRRRKALHPAKRLRIGFGGGEILLLIGGGCDGHQDWLQSCECEFRITRQHQAHPAFAPG
ncbi:hypothetical protein ACVIHF_002515 [Bradyrhizobium sp. USDA 4506]